MGPNRISASIDLNTIQDINLSLEKVRASLPFLLQLAAADRPSLPHLDVELKPFLENAVSDSKNFADLVPPGLDVDELERDYVLYQQLVDIIQPIQELLDLIQDTALAAGSDAFETAIIFYKNVRMSARLGDDSANKVLEGLRRNLPEWRKD